MSHRQFNKKDVRRAFSRSAHTYDEVAVLQKEVGNRLFERLDYIKLKPDVILDAGAGTGHFVSALSKKYKQSQVIGLDLAVPMLKKVRKRGRFWRKPGCICGDLESLPLADKSVDLIFSNLALQWVNNLEMVFKECLRVLKPGGLLMFTTFGPDTLKELRASWSVVDEMTHVSHFPDMHLVGDALVSARLADPVMDVEHISLTYGEVSSLMRDLKTLGASNMSAERSRGMMGKDRMSAMKAAYEAHRVDGRLPASYEVVYGHAWAPESMPQTQVSGETRVPLTVLQSKSRPVSK